MVLTHRAVAAGVREMLLVVGLAAAGLLMVAAVTLGPYVAAKMGSEPGQIIEVGVPGALP
jgi:hypothetical protein